MNPDHKNQAKFDAEADVGELLYRDVTARLQRIFDERLDDLSAIALMHVITMGRIVFRDGFVLNGDRLQENIMGIGDAADIVSRLRPDQRWEYWKGEYSARRGRIDEFQQAVQRVVEQIRAHPTVRSVNWE